jgi:ribose transport system permease protein
MMDDTAQKQSMFDLQTLTRWIRRRAVLLAFVLMCIFFSTQSSLFMTTNNIINIFDQSVILIMLSMGMTLVVLSGGIDLSVPVAFDFGALAAITLLQDEQPWMLAIVAGIGLGLCVGLFNAIVILRIGVSPFLATLATLFIGESIQRIYTEGGEPIYLARLPTDYKFIGKGRLFDGELPFDIVIAGITLFIFYLLIEQTIHGKRWRAIGLQRASARVAGLRVERYVGLSYVLAATVAAVGGIMLSSTLSSYVPMSGNGYLFDAIAAVFIGTAVDKEGRPSVPGTLLGVLFLSVVTNGLRLMRVHFYWQTVARGSVMLVVLAIGALTQLRKN